MDDLGTSLPDEASAPASGAEVFVVDAPLQEVRWASRPGSGDRDDDDLMRAAAAEDTSAFPALVRRHEARLLGFLTRMVGSGDDARDVCQDVFVEVWRHRHRYRPEGHFVAWLFRIARSRAISRGRRRRLQALFLGAAEPPPPTPDADVVVEERRRRQRLERALARLPAAAREALALRHGAALDYLEVASVLGISEAAARQRCSRALAHLRSLLEEVDA